MTLESDVRRGEQARQVIESPVYVAAYEQIEQAILANWKDSRDAAEREELHRLHRSLLKVRTLMEATMRSGEIAQAELKRKRSIGDRLKAFAA